MLMPTLFDFDGAGLQEAAARLIVVLLWSAAIAVLAKAVFANPLAIAWKAAWSARGHRLAGAEQLAERLRWSLNSGLRFDSAVAQGKAPGTPLSEADKEDAAVQFASVEEEIRRVSSVPRSAWLLAHLLNCVECQAFWIALGLVFAVDAREVVGWSFAAFAANALLSAAAYATIVGKLTKNGSCGVR